MSGHIILLVSFSFLLAIGFNHRSHAGPVTDAALAGDVDVITRLLDEGAEVDETGIAGPLYFAIQRGHTDAALLLIKRGADVNRHSKFGTPLHISSRKGNAEIVQALLERGADPAVQGRDDETTPLHEAALGGSVEAAALLLEYGADVNAETRFREPPIHYAKKKGHEDIVRFLQENGASPPSVEPISTLLATADLEKGRLRAVECTACHALEQDRVSEAPNLWGVVGRTKASLEKYPYSDALKAEEGAWGFEELNRFLAHTTRTVPGTNMHIGFEPDRQVRINLIAYLRTLNDKPIPLP